MGKRNHIEGNTGASPGRAGQERIRVEFHGRQAQRYQRILGPWIFMVMNITALLGKLHEQAGLIDAFLLRIVLVALVPNLKAFRSLGVMRKAHIQSRELLPSAVWKNLLVA